MDNYELECLIEGDDSTIIVTVPRTADVQELKQLIYQEAEFDGLRIYDLKLLKVCHESHNHSLR
jgi:Crinkler effector protein N-terminal domain